MRRTSRFAFLSAAAAVAVVALAGAPAQADPWDLSTGWVTESVEGAGLVGATCDLDGDGATTYYAVVPGQSIDLSLKLRWLADTAHEEREILMWHHLDHLAFATTDGEPSTIVIDARTLTTGYVIEVQVGDDWVETGEMSVVGHGIVTDTDGVRLYSGPWQYSAEMTLEGFTLTSQTGPCVLDLR